MAHKAGFVNIIGNPNVGKSTIMNALVGERLSIITSKAQTTRHRIQGIVNGEDFQIVYSDTPGILKPNYKLQESMMKFVNTAISDADTILYVTDVKETSDKNQEYIDKIKHNTERVIVVINKIDLCDQDALEALVNKWETILPGAKIIPTSATENFNLDTLLNNIIVSLPENPPFYPKDQLTDRTERFFAQEIIREKILIHYKKEIPYSVEVEIEAFQEDDKIIRISAVINVVRESQKGIIIGHKGAALKRIGTEARKDMEIFFDKKVFLEVFVRVKKDWRDKDNMLRQFGYNS